MLNRGPIPMLARQHHVNCGNLKKEQTNQESDRYLAPQMHRWLSESARKSREVLLLTMTKLRKMETKSTERNTGRRPVQARRTFDTRRE